MSLCTCRIEDQEVTLLEIYMILTESSYEVDSDRMVESRTWTAKSNQRRLWMFYSKELQNWNH